jgi:hypothetical protein
MPPNADALRAFEYAGWERAAAHYNDAFADATMRFLHRTSLQNHHMLG